MTAQETSLTFIDNICLSWVWICKGIFNVSHSHTCSLIKNEIYIKSLCQDVFTLQLSPGCKSKGLCEWLQSSTHCRKDCFCYLQQQGIFMWAINAVDIYFLVVNYDLLEKRICRKHHYQQLIVSLLYKQLDTKCLALVEYWSIRM